MGLLWMEVFSASVNDEHGQWWEDDMALTAAQLVQLQQQLQARRAELRGLVQHGVAEAGRERQTGDVYDSGDEALTDLQVDMDLAMGDMGFEEMRDIDAALARMAEGAVWRFRWRVCRASLRRAVVSGVRERWSTGAGARHIVCK
jgi:RNA polymerase-binding transcription factor DksA